MSRKKPFVTDNSIEILNEPNEEDMEICGFTEAADISGTPIVSFNFRQDTDILNAKAIEEPAPVMSETKASFENKPVISDKLIDNRTLQSQPNGITPPDLTSLSYEAVPYLIELKDRGNNHTKLIIIENLAYKTFPLYCVKPIDNHFTL